MGQQKTSCADDLLTGILRRQNMHHLESFTGFYQKAKTLRFDLIPIGNTLKKINRNGILKMNLALAERYKRIKNTIDSYHKEFIENRLSLLSGDNAFEDLLAEYVDEKMEERKNEMFAVRC